MIPFPPYRAPAICAVAVLIATSAHAATVYVDDDAPFGGDGATWNTAYRFLSDGLAAAAPSDIIKVGAGTHRPDESAANPDGTGDITLYFTLEDGQKLRGGYAGYGAPDPDERDLDLYPTTLSGDLDDDDEPGFVNRDDNAFNVVDLGSRIDVILNGLTIRGGHADTGPYRGAGVHISSGLATIKRCRIIDNYAAGNGAGVSTNAISFEIDDCELRGNLSSSSGGGLRANEDCDLVVLNCRFHDNTADVGGGLSAGTNGTAQLEDSLFQGNFALAGGGGAAILNQTSVQILRCDFDRNTAVPTNGSGGGLILSADDSTVQDSTFTNNVSSFLGGGAALSSTDAVISNCLFSRNGSDRGAGVYTSRSVEFIGCTFSRNDGHGIWTDGASSLSTVRNSIAWGNSNPQIRGQSSVTYSCVENGQSGAGNIDDDPLFVQAGTDDLRLSDGSPCLDVGNNSAVPAGVTLDLDGNPRIANGTVDMGCYEGVFTAMPEAASVTDLDQGEAVILAIAGTGWDPLHQSTLVIANESGDDDATFLATVIESGPGPVVGGFSVNGAVIQIETEGMNDGEFSVLFLEPVDPERLDGADPLRLDVTRLHNTGFWSLAVATNTVNSPDQIGPIGDRHAALAPEPMGISNQIGDYGVWWDDAAQEGVAWSNVDRQGTYAIGVPQHPADCLQPPNDFVDFHDLLFVIGYWGAGPGPFDVDDSGEVGLLDIVEVLSRWGACP